MSQARKIYDFLAQTGNRSADSALLLGFRLAEEPYQIAILETILDRGQSEGTCRLIESYHRFEPAWQEMLHQRVGDLYSGLRLAGSSEVSQTRLNVLAILRRGRYRRLADLVVTMLHDSEGQIAQQAAIVLLEMAQQFAQNDELDTVREAGVVPISEDAAGWTETYLPADPTRKNSDRQIVLSALERAIEQYGKLHKREEVILAAMYVAPAYWGHFWKNYFDHHDVVGCSVRQFIVRYDQPELARFDLSALGNPYLRPVAARALARHGRHDFLVAVARMLHKENNDQIAEGLKLIRNPIWLRPERLPLTSFSPEDQSALVGFITALGVKREFVADYLGHFVDEAAETVLFKTVEIFSELPWPMVAEPMGRILESRHGQAALAGLVQAIKMDSRQLPEIMARQLNSPHEHVRKIAQNYCKKIAFTSYWNSFAKMSDKQRMAAGKAVFKIDGDAPNRWRKCAESKIPNERLRAVLMARLLGLVDKCLETLCDLAVDSDQMVRSCAVAAMGEAASTTNDSIGQRLAEALDDSDPRVQANAIEAMEHRGEAKAADKIKLLMQSDNNRVRANAVKAMIRWKAASAQQVVNAMLTDRRTSHRRSGLWLVQNIQDSNTGDLSGAMEKKYATASGDIGV